MSFSQTAISRAVRSYMDTHKPRRLSLKAMADLIPMSTTSLTDRLRGKVRWTLDDADRLAELRVVTRPEWSARFDAPGGAE